MATRDEIIETIRTSALDETDVFAIIQALAEKMIGEAFVSTGMDLLTGNRQGKDQGNVPPA
jgi:hypothetical protein